MRQAIPVSLARQRLAARSRLFPKPQELHPYPLRFEESSTHSTALNWAPLIEADKTHHDKLQRPPKVLWAHWWLGDLLEAFADLKLAHDLYGYRENPGGMSLLLPESQPLAEAGPVQWIRLTRPMNVLT